MTSVLITLKIRPWTPIGKVESGVFIIELLNHCSTSLQNLKSSMKLYDEMIALKLLKHQNT